MTDTHINNAFFFVLFGGFAFAGLQGLAQIGISPAVVSSTHTMAHWLVTTIGV